MKFYTQPLYDMCAVFTTDSIHIGWILTTVDSKWTYTVVNYKCKTEPYATKQEALDAFIDHYHRLNWWVNAPKSKARINKVGTFSTAWGIDAYKKN